MKYDKICNAINDLIVKQQLKPGDRLPAERYLAAQLQVSRNCVREALHMLEARSVITSRRGSGTYVKFSPSEVSSTFTDSSNLKNLIDILDLRTVIEVYGFTKVAELTTPEDVRQLRMTEERLFTDVLDASIEGKPFPSTPINFEEAIMSLQKNEHLRMLHASLCLEWKNCLGKDVMVSMSAIARHKQHLLILNAIAEKNPEKIKKAVESHHAMTKKSILYFMDHSEDRV